MQKELDSGKNIYQVDIETKLSTKKPIHARWIIRLYNKFRNSDEMVIKAFQVASITETLGATHISMFPTLSVKLTLVGGWVSTVTLKLYSELSVF